MNNKLRNYKVKFRLRVGDPTSKSTNLLRYYMPKWSVFMSRVMSHKLPAAATERGAVSVKELPYLRKVVDTSLVVEDIVPLLNKHDETLTRLVIDAAPFFNSAPQDLKVHILAVFGIDAKELENYLAVNN